MYVFKKNEVNRSTFLYKNIKNKQINKTHIRNFYTLLIIREFMFTLTEEHKSNLR